MTKNLWTSLLTTILLVLVLTAPAYAQAQKVTNTTFSAAVTATTRTVTVASATGIAVGGYLFSDLEEMQVTTVSGTTIGVQRGVGGTVNSTHANARRVYVSSTTAPFYDSDPKWGTTCTWGTGDASVQPWINTKNGRIWWCPAPSGSWAVGIALPLTVNSF